MLNSLTKFLVQYEGTLLGQLAVLVGLCLLWYRVKPKLHHSLQGFHSSQLYWKDVQKRTGYFGPCSKELMWNSMSCLQHFLAGSLMAIGWVFGEVKPDTIWEVDPERRMLMFFRLGVVAEVSFELLDIIDMINAQGMWATTKENPKIHPGAYVSAIAHHLPGLCLVFPLNLWCSCVGLWQRCAVALELGGGVSGFLLCYRETLLGEGAGSRVKIFLTDVASLLFLMWARFLVVTPAMYEISKTGLEVNCKTTYAVIVGAVSMTIFNIMWLIDVILKVYNSALLAREAPAVVKKKKQ